MPEHEYRYLARDKKWTSKRLEVLADDASKNLKLIGTAKGLNLQECIFGAIINTPDFLNRLVAYRVEAQDESTTAVSISFWEKGEFKKSI